MERIKARFQLSVDSEFQHLTGVQNYKNLLQNLSEDDFMVDSMRFLRENLEGSQLFYAQSRIPYSIERIKNVEPSRVLHYQANKLKFEIESEVVEIISVNVEHVTFMFQKEIRSSKILSNMRIFVE